MTQRTHRSMTRLTSSACLLLGLFGVTSAGATVTEPSGLQVPIPQEQSNDYFDTTRYNVTTLGMQYLFDAWEGAGVIDAYADASSTNVAFSPLCGLSGSLILRGGSCKVPFGWYCTSDPVGSEVIHPLVTVADVVNYHDNLQSFDGVYPLPAGLDSWTKLKNDAQGFVPTIQAGLVQPVVGSVSLSSVRTDPDFLACASGKIAFAFQGNPASICPMSKFSEPERNQMSTYGDPWISAVVYESKKFPGSFYIAFEDMPTTADSFTPTMGVVAQTYTQMTGSSGWQNWKNDGDFNDMVFKVDGIMCSGGGQACTPSDAEGNPLLGTCSVGVTACTVDGGNNTCTQKFFPATESCNGWDDDCNGISDDGEGLCPEGEVCDNGTCVGACGSGEFICDSGLVCKTSGLLAGYCVAADCAEVDCDEGMRCEAGECVGGCEGVTCPGGTVCLAGSCIDLCANTTCPDSYVCESGACIPNCGCLPCTDPNKSYCNDDGRCIDPACADVNCEAYTTCVAGECVDPCDSDPCGTAECTTTESGSFSCPNGLVGTPGTGGTGGTGGGLIVGTTPGDGNTVFSGDDSGCACRVSSVPSKSGLYLLSLLGLSGVAMRLTRRTRRR